MGWGQLTYRTDIDGEIGKGPQHIYGPYLKTAARNPMNRSTEICSMNHVGPGVGWAWNPAAEQLYAVLTEDQLAQVGLPADDFLTYSEKQHRQAAHLTSNLAVLRNAIDLYATEHAGVYPRLKTIVEQLTTYTNTHGEASPKTTGAHIYGPYIRRIPENPFVRQRAICAFDKPDITSGYAYDEETGKILAIIPKGGVEFSVLGHLRDNYVVPLKPDAVE